MCHSVIVIYNGRENQEKQTLIELKLPCSIFTLSKIPFFSFYHHILSIYILLLLCMCHVDYDFRVILIAALSLKGEMFVCLVGL